LRHDRIEAPWFLECPIDGDSFRQIELMLLDFFGGARLLPQGRHLGAGGPKGSVGAHPGPLLVQYSTNLKCRFICIGG